MHTQGRVVHNHYSITTAHHPTHSASGSTDCTIILTPHSSSSATLPNTITPFTITSHTSLITPHSEHHLTPSTITTPLASSLTDPSTPHTLTLTPPHPHTLTPSHLLCSSVGGWHHFGNVVVTMGNDHIFDVIACVNDF